MKGILIYRTAGKTINHLLDNCENVVYAVSKQRVYRRKNGDRVYMRGLPHTCLYVAFRYGYRGSNIPEGVVDFMGGADFVTGSRYRPMTLASKKLEFRRWAMNNDVSVPYTWVKGEEPVFPALGRPMKHTQGKDYHIYEDPDSYFSSDDGYYSELLEKQAEYRVYVFGGHCWCVSKKNPKEGVSSTDPWNFSTNNATFKILKVSDYPTDAVGLAVETCYKMGLWMAGVDIIQAENNYYIVEVNNAPAVQGKLKPKNLGKILDYTTKRIGDGWEPELAAPDHPKYYRHPALL